MAAPVLRGTCGLIESMFQRSWRRPAWCTIPNLGQGRHYRLLLPLAVAITEANQGFTSVCTVPCPDGPNTHGK